MQQKPNNFLAGMEEAVARFLSLIVSLIFFSINILSQTPQRFTFEWKNLMIYLAIFWLVYEFCAFFLFLVLLQFSKNKNLQKELEKKEAEEKAKQSELSKKEEVKVETTTKSLESPVNSEEPETLVTETKSQTKTVEELPQKNTDENL